MSTKTFLHSSSQVPRRAMSSTARKPVQLSKARKSDALSKGRAARKSGVANLRNQILSKIVSVVTEHVDRIDDTEVPRVLKQLDARHSLEQALRDTFAHTQYRSAAGGEIPAENQQALNRAQARAAVAKMDLLKRADMLTGAQLAERLGLTRATVDKRRTERRLLALDFGTKRGFRYPAWQGDLVQDADARATFEQVLHLLGAEGNWSQYRFLTQVAPVLGGINPTDALRAGRRDEVLRAAESWAAGAQGGG
jgi:hypothetical protein